MTFADFQKLASTAPIIGWTYEEAAKIAGLSVRSLKAAAGTATKQNLERRLRVKRLGHRTVRVQPMDLWHWLQRREWTG